MLLMGKSTISMVIFNSKLLIYQRVIVSQHIIFILREVLMKQTREWSFAHVCSTINIRPPDTRVSPHYVRDGTGQNLDTHCFNLEWIEQSSWACECLPSGNLT